MTARTLLLLSAVVEKRFAREELSRSRRQLCPLPHSLPLERVSELSLVRPVPDGWQGPNSRPSPTGLRLLEAPRTNGARAPRAAAASPDRSPTPGRASPCRTTTAPSPPRAPDRPGRGCRVRAVPSGRAGARAFREDQKKKPSQVPKVDPPGVAERIRPDRRATDGPLFPPPFPAPHPSSGRLEENRLRRRRPSHLRSSPPKALRSDCLSRLPMAVRGSVEHQWQCSKQLRDKPSSSFEEAESKDQVRQKETRDLGPCAPCQRFFPPGPASSARFPVELAKVNSGSSKRPVQGQRWSRSRKTNVELPARGLDLTSSATPRSVFH